MNIGQAAQASGVSAKMIRYYEAIGLITPPDRSQGNYRIYGTEDIHTLRFIKRARTLGFSVDETGQLLGLWRDKSRASGDVKAIAERHIEALRAKITDLQGMVDTLAHLSHCCMGDDRPSCPILNDLAGNPALPPAQETSK